MALESNPVRKADTPQWAFLFGPESDDWIDIIHAYSIAESDVDRGGISRDSLLEAGSAAFLAIQTYLRARLDNRLPDSVRFHLGVAVYWQRAAIRDCGHASEMDIKRVELELLGASAPLEFCWTPLGFCWGTVKLVLMHGKPNDVLVPGCGRVFIDRCGATGGRRPWQRWCHEHRAKNHPERHLLPAYIREAIRSPK